MRWAANLFLKGDLNLRVYITAPFQLRDHAILLMDAYESKGIIVTARWLKRSDANSDASARMDLGDVAAAQTLVALNPPGWENSGTGGRHVELGYALGLGRGIMLLGRRTNIFHYFDHVVQLDLDVPIDQQITAMDRAYALRSWMY